MLSIDERKIFEEIIRCPHVIECIVKKETKNPCFKITNNQKEIFKSISIDEFQGPEPWCGHLESAPILFLSENPTININEKFKSWKDWENSPDDVLDFYINRFKNGYVENHHGIYYYFKAPVNGKEKDWSRAWAQLKNMAKLLINIDEKTILQTGKYFSYVDIVHCKSIKEHGVEEAKKICIDLYLQKLLTISNAKVIITLGDRAKKALNELIKEKEIESNSNMKKVNLYGKIRWIIYGPHTNYRGKRRLDQILDKRSIEIIRNWLNS